MIFYWQDILPTALALLTDLEKRAIDCSLSLDRGVKNPGETRLAKFGLSDLMQYENARDSGRKKLIDYFRSFGIHSIADLPFPEPNRSADCILSHVNLKVSSTVKAKGTQKRNRTKTAAESEV